MTGTVQENSNQIYVIGLLHDLGRWVTANYMPEVHQHILAQNNPGAENHDIIAMERKHIGLDHSQIGAALLERWGLPLSLVQGVRFHHEPPLLQVWDRVDENLLEREVGDRPEWSEVLGLWWVTVPHPDLGPTLRLARDPAGEDLLLTPLEKERRALEEERRALEEERRAREEERRAREAAEARVRELEAELRRRRG